MLDAQGANGPGNDDVGGPRLAADAALETPNVSTLYEPDSLSLPPEDVVVGEDNQGEHGLQPEMNADVGADVDTGADVDGPGEGEHLVGPEAVQSMETSRDEHDQKPGAVNDVEAGTAKPSLANASQANEFDETSGRSPSLCSSICRISLFWVLAWTLHVAAMLPTSLYYDSGLAVKFLWWAFWLCSIPSALAGMSFILLQGLDYSYWLVAELFRKRNPWMCLCHCLYWFPVGLVWCLGFAMLPTLLAGWYLLAEGADVASLPIARDVTPDQLSRLYQKEYPPAMYVLVGGIGGGFLQDEHAGVYTDYPMAWVNEFMFDCHGFYKSKTCTRQDCEAIEDVGGSPYQECKKVWYECGGWEYSKRCPGYQLFEITPLWTHQGETITRAASPAALVYRYRTFLFETDAMRQRHIFDETSRHKFSSKRVSDDSLCALDTRHNLDEHWLAHPTTYILQKEVGQYAHKDMTRREVLDEVFRVQRSKTPWDADFPLLWMPDDVDRLCYSLMDTADESVRGINRAEAILWVCLAWNVAMCVSTGICFWYKAVYGDE